MSWIAEDYRRNKMIGIFIALWWASGIAGFIYWWTSEFDFEVVDIIPVIFVGSLGPLAFIFGCIAHNTDSIIIKGRKSK
jgi:hypothetical protein